MGIRFFAYALDGLILLALAVLVGIVSGVPIDKLVDFALYNLNEYQLSMVFNTLLSIVYMVVFPITSLRGTPGKFILKLKIEDKNGNKIGFFRSLIRFLSSFLSYAILGIGYIIIAFHPQKRALHDLIAGTFVLKET